MCVSSKSRWNRQVVNFRKRWQGVNHAEIALGFSEANDEFEEFALR